MNMFNYRLVQKYAKLAILFVKLAQEILKLLSMAFNYLQPQYLCHDYT
jgi:hypothetical protein